MSKTIDYDQVLTDVSAYIPDGIVDFTNPLHLQVLREALMEMRYPDEFINEYSNGIYQTAILLNEKESVAAKKAHKMGLTNVGYGKWVDPKDPKRVVAKSDTGGKALIPVKGGAAKKGVPAKGKKVAPVGKKGTQPSKPAQKVGKPTKGKKPAPAKSAKTAKNVAPEKPSTPFSAKGQATSGMFSDKYETVTVGGKSAQVRQMVDPATKLPIDVSTPEGVKRAAVVSDERLAKLKKKIDLATFLVGDGKKNNEAFDKFLKSYPDASKNSIKKWLGEIGEVAALNALLVQNVPAWLLPDSEPHNDILAEIYDEARGIQLLYVSVKSTKKGQELNGLGSSIVPDILHAVDLGTTDRMKVRVGDQVGDVSAKTTAVSAIRAKEFLWKAITSGRTCRGAMSTTGLKDSQFLPGYKNVKHPKTGKPLFGALPGKRSGFIGADSQSVFAKYRLISPDEIQKLLQLPEFNDVFQDAEGKRPSDEEGATLKASFSEQLLKMSQDTQNPLTLDRMNDWVEETLGDILGQTQGKPIPSSDMAGYYVDPVTKTQSVGWTTKEAMEAENTKVHGSFEGKDGKSRLGYIGIRQSSRGMDVSTTQLVKNCEGYARTVTNSQSDTKYAHLVVGTPEYLAYLKSKGK